MTNNTKSRRRMFLAGATIAVLADMARANQDPIPLIDFHGYLQPQRRPAAEKFFRQNWVRAFQWVRCDPRQPQSA